MGFKINEKHHVLGRISFYMLTAVLSIRILSIFLMGPMPQDAYYFFYAQHPALSYFDHPPMVAYMLKLFTWAFGNGVVIIKLANSCFTLFTAVALYFLALRFLPKYLAKRSIVLFLSTLMVSILSLISTPDTPLLLFWTLSLLALYEAIFNHKTAFWIVAGILMGLAFDSKYTAVFLPFGLFLFLLVSRTKRSLLFTIWPYLSCIAMFLTAAPVVIWNINNQFASFNFQGTERLNDASGLCFNLKYVSGLFGHQLALLMPVLLVAILIPVVHLTKVFIQKSKPVATKWLFLLCFFLPIFSTFLCLSPVYWVKINWMMPAYITGIIIAAKFIQAKWIKIQVGFSFLVHTALLIQLIWYPFSIKSDDTWVGWKTLSSQVKQLKNKYDADFIFSADGYKTSSELNLFSKTFIYGENVIGEQALHYDFIGTDLKVLNGKTAIFVDSDPGFKTNGKNPERPSNLESYFKTVRQLKPLIIEKQGKPVRKFYIYLCKGYKFIRKR